MEPELVHRARDLARGAEKYAAQTASYFLTPAEQQTLTQHLLREGITMVLHGGGTDCERQCAFFLPTWQTAEDLDPAQTIGALRITAAFGTPGHRDYLGAILALGVTRESLGDLRVSGQSAYLFCLHTVARYLCDNLEKVGRCGVKAQVIAPTEVPAPVREYETVRFTVSSLRLDAVCAHMFGLSRTAAQAQIVQGAVCVNYLPCLKPDAPLSPGDILSLRGGGKGTLGETGGASRKGRLFVSAALWK